MLGKIFEMQNSLLLIGVVVFVFGFSRQLSHLHNIYTRAVLLLNISRQRFCCCCCLCAWWPAVLVLGDGAICVLFTCNTPFVVVVTTSESERKVMSSFILHTHAHIHTSAFHAHRFCWTSHVAVLWLIWGNHRWFDTFGHYVIMWRLMREFGYRVLGCRKFQRFFMRKRRC